MEAVQYEEVKDLLLRGKFALALPVLRERVRRKHSAGASSGGDAQQSSKRFPSFEFDRQVEAEQECAEDLFALALWEAREDDSDVGLREDVQLLERAVLGMGPGELSFSTLTAWLVLRTRPGLPANELEEGRRLVETYLAPCLKAAANLVAAQQMYLRLVEILVMHAALPEEAALTLLRRPEHAHISGMAELEARFQKRVDAAAAVAAAATKEEPAKAQQQEDVPAPVSATSTTAQELVQEFERTQQQRAPAAPAAPAGNGGRKKDLLLKREQALMLAASCTSLFFLFILLRFRQRLAQGLFNLGDLLFGK